MSKTVVFFGNERLATGVHTDAPTLQALIQNGYDVKMVIVNYDSSKSNNSKALEISQITEQNNIPLLMPKKLSDIRESLAMAAAEIGVLVAYGKIIPQEVINLFPSGIINVHPSLLPLHRGPAPIESVILAGDQKTGVSIMQLSADMDAGPVYAQSEVALNGQETKISLAGSLLDIGQAMIIELLPDILSGQVVALPQDNSHASYDRLIVKDDGLIDWRRPAIELDRQIRAFLEWPKSHTQLAGNDVIITKAHVTTSYAISAQPGQLTFMKDTGIIQVVTGDGLLAIERLKPAGKSEMSAIAFAAGYIR